MCAAAIDRACRSPTTSARVPPACLLRPLPRHEHFGAQPPAPDHLLVLHVPARPQVRREPLRAAPPHGPGRDAVELLPAPRGKAAPRVRPVREATESEDPAGAEDDREEEQVAALSASISSHTITIT